MFLAEVLVRADLLCVSFADRAVAGSGLIFFHLPIAQEIGRPSALAVAHFSPRSANDDTVDSVRHFHLEAHISIIRAFVGS